MVTRFSWRVAMLRLGGVLESETPQSVTAFAHDKTGPEIVKSSYRQFGPAQAGIKEICLDLFPRLQVSGSFGPGEPTGVKRL